LRLRCGAERVVALRGACRCAGWTSQPGHGKLLPSRGSSRSRSAAERCSFRLPGACRGPRVSVSLRERCRRVRGVSSFRGAAVFTHRGCRLSQRGLPWQRSSSTGESVARRAGCTVVGRYRHRRCRLFSLPQAHHTVTTTLPPAHHPVDISGAPHTSLLTGRHHTFGHSSPRCRTHHPKDIPASPHTSWLTPKHSPPVSHSRGHGEPPSRRRFALDQPRAAAQRRLR